MNNSKKYRLLELIGEFKKLNAMILLHRDLGKDEFMAMQYDSKKARLMKKLISELTSSSIDSTQALSLFAKIIF